MTDDESGVVAGAARIRETAKWLTISLATVGGILLAGSQLSDIGNLKPGTGRFVAALSGGLVATGAAVVIMWLSILIATSRSMTMAALTSAEWARPKGLDDLLTDERFLDGRSSVSELDGEFTTVLRQRQAAYKTLDQTAAWAHEAQLAQVDAIHQLETDPELALPQFAGMREAVMQKATEAAKELKAANAALIAHRDAATVANSNATALSATVAALLQAASYRNLAYRWRRTGIGILSCGFLAACGIGLFVWAANPPPSVKASVATPTVLTTPGRATVKLTVQGMDALRVALGDGCPVSTPLSALDLGSTDAGTDVLVQQAGCTPTRFVAVPEWASVLDQP